MLTAVAEKIGLIAGAGRFPWLIAEEARRMGHEVHVIAIEGVTDPGLADVVTSYHPFKLGQVSKPIQALKDAGVTQAMMAGRVRHNKLFGGILPDLRAVKILATLKDRRTDSLLGRIAEEFAKDGIEIINSATFLKHLIPEEGTLTSIEPTAAQMRDVEMGWKVAKALSGHDVGQSVVVSHGTIVAVEAMEGTDACVHRAAELARENGEKNPELVLVKVAKPKQDFRFDLPVLGLDTLKTIEAAGLKVLVIEAGRSLILDKEEFLRSAERLGAAVVAMTE